MSIARITPIVGSLYALMRQALDLNVATPLGSQELSCTVAPARRLVVLGSTPIAGFAVDHGTVADEAAMLALHTLDSATLIVAPTFVAPGDSCTRTDDPGWRWHCIAGHGTALADWERRPLSGALAGLAVSEHTHAISGVPGLQTALDGKQPAHTNLTTLAGVASTTAGRALLQVATPATAQLPRVNADGTITMIDVPSGGGSGAVAVAPDGPPVEELALTYTSAGDTGGLVYAIATDRGSHAFANPAQTAAWVAGKIATLRSGDGTGTALDATDRAANDNSHCSPGNGSWWCWDFGPLSCIRPTCYTLRNRASYSDMNVLRNWKLQGTNTVSAWTTAGIAAATWVDLDTRTNDTTIAGASGAWGTFTLCSQPETAYRYLRIVLTGTDSSGTYYLVMSELEVYGTAQLAYRLPDGMTGWMTDGVGHYWPYY